MKKIYRIKKTPEIDLVFKNKISVGNSYFAIYTKNTTQQNFKFAISIGKKYGSSVERNLCKRRIRAVIRSLKDEISPNCQLVIVVKPKVRELTFNEIEKNISSLLSKIKKLESKEELKCES